MKVKAKLTIFTLVTLIAFVSACSSSSVNESPEPNTTVPTASPGPGTDTGIGEPTTGPFNSGPAPTAALRPVPGELSFYQIPVTGPWLGEAAAIIGPDGTLVLLDIGSFDHDDIVRE